MRRSAQAPHFWFMADYFHEEKHRASGLTVICGVDEAGRGPLAGPVSAAAVILPKGYVAEGLDDSKKLTEKRRELLYRQLMNDDAVIKCIAWGSVDEILELNILHATHLAMRRAVEGLSMKPEMCLIDGLPVKGIPFPSEALVKGDSLSLSISAASVLAKVARDHLMQEAEEKWPGYGFARHKGYGTKAHLEALRELGPCPIHRKGFAPIAQLELGLSS